MVLENSFLIGFPTPTAWLISKLCCNCRVSSSDILESQSGPKPVFIPYTVCPDATILATFCCDFVICCLLSSFNAISMFPCFIPL